MNEDIIDDLTGELEDSVEARKDRDVIWHKIVVPLHFAGMHYFDDELTLQERMFLAELEACYEGENVNKERFPDLWKEIHEYGKSIDIKDMLHRYIAGQLRSLAYYPLTQEDWDNGPIWLFVSGWIAMGIPLEWIHQRLTETKALL